MKNDLPNWVQNPFFFGPFFAFCLSIPFLIGMNEHAAEFAGGLSAALAAVIAVVVGGSIQRANDRAREHRESARRISLLVRESWGIVLVYMHATRAFIDNTQKAADAGSQQNPDTLRENLLGLTLPWTNLNAIKWFEISDDVTVELLVTLESAVRLNALATSPSVDKSPYKVLSELRLHLLVLESLSKALSGARKQILDDLEN